MEQLNSLVWEKTYLKSCSTMASFAAVLICKNAIGKTIFHDFHSDIQCPITAIWADDDEIATKRNVQELLSLYPNANKK